MKFFLVLILVLSFNANAGFFDVIHAPTGNHCKDQLKGFLYSHFGDGLVIENTTSTNISLAKNSKKKGYWMRNNLCKGYIVAETISKPTCKVRHYGTVPNYIKRVWGKGDCKYLIPKDLYPRKRDYKHIYNQ